MADVILSGNANWSTCKAGGPPGATDTIYLGSGGTSGFKLTLDGAKDATYTCSAIWAMNGNDKTTYNNGLIFVTSGASPGCSIVADLYAGTTTLLNAGLTKRIAYVKSATGGTAANAACISGTGSTGNVMLVDYAKAGTASGAHGVRMSTSSAISPTVTVASGGNTSWAYGVYATASTGTPTITNAYGGSAAYSFGVYQSAGLNITTISYAKGGSHSLAFGVAGGGTSRPFAITTCDPSGVAPPVGNIYISVSSGAFVGFTDNNSGSICIEQSAIVATSNIKSGVPQYSGSSGSGTYPINNESYSISS